MLKIMKLEDLPSAPVSNLSVPPGISSTPLHLTCSDDSRHRVTVRSQHLVFSITEAVPALNIGLSSKLEWRSGIAIITTSLAGKVGEDSLVIVSAVVVVRVSLVVAAIFAGKSACSRLERGQNRRIVFYGRDVNVTVGGLKGKGSISIPALPVGDQGMVHGSWSSAKAASRSDIFYEANAVLVGSLWCDCHQGWVVRHRLSLVDFCHSHLSSSEWCFLTYYHNSSSLQSLEVPLFGYWLSIKKRKRISIKKIPLSIEST